MDYDKLNRWLTLTANIGVLLGLFVVVFELQQSRLVTEAQTRSDISNSSSDSTLRWAESPEIVSVLSKLLSGEELSSEEEIVLSFIRVSELRRWENTYYQYERGLFEESEFVALSQAWRTRFNGPMYEDYWTPANRNRYSTSFIEFINGLIEE